MLKIIRNRIEQGCKTTAYPKEQVELYKGYRGLPRINRECDLAIVRRCAAVCPQDAIMWQERKIDLGKCTFCGHCENVSGGAFVTFTQKFAMGAAAREALICDGSLPALKVHAKQQFRKLFGRSLQLRQVSAGGCNACEADTNVLNTPFFDLSRFGIEFVASPRHADGMHVTGPISRNMLAALIATWEAIPSPKVVIACGCCPISGGPFYGSDQVIADLNSIIPVDLYIPGCPPHPFTTLHALLNYFR